MTTPVTGPTTSRPTGFWAGIPRRARLDEGSIVSRHRIISAVLALHPPVLAAIGLSRGVGGLLLWGQLAVIAVLLVAGQVLRSQVVRASAVSLGLMIGADVLVHVSGGLTDVHIWFYAVMALVALYQMWTPFLLAVGFVAVHHAAMSLWMPASVFSTHQAQMHPILFALLHAVFLLAEATFLAYGWKFTEEADRGRRAEQQRAEEQAVAQIAAEAELAASGPAPRRRPPPVWRGRRRRRGADDDRRRGGGAERLDRPGAGGDRRGVGAGDADGSGPAADRRARLIVSIRADSVTGVTDAR